MFSAVNQTCPLCNCCQPKVKKMGKCAILLQPLSARQAARNSDRNFKLLCVLSRSVLTNRARSILCTLAPLPCGARQFPSPVSAVLLMHAGLKEAGLRVVPLESNADAHAIMLMA